MTTQGRPGNGGAAVAALIAAADGMAAFGRPLLPLTIAVSVGSYGATAQ